MSLKVIHGSRGVGKSMLLVKDMIDNNVHHVFCGNTEKMRERIHYAGGRDIAVYHYSDIDSMKDFDLQNVAYYIDDIDAFMECVHPGCKKVTMSIGGNE